MGWLDLRGRCPKFQHQEPSNCRDVGTLFFLTASWPQNNAVSSVSFRWGGRVDTEWCVLLVTSAEDFLQGGNHGEKLAILIGTALQDEKDDTVRVWLIRALAQMGDSASLSVTTDIPKSESLGDELGRMFRPFYVSCAAHNP